MDADRFLPGFFVVILGFSLMAGCIPIPAPPHGLGVIPDKEGFESFRIDVSKRADILLVLGEPQYRLDEDRFLLYEWTVAYGYLLIGGPGAGAALPVTAPHFFCFEFGSDSKLLRKEHLVGSIYGGPEKVQKRCLNPSAAEIESDAK
jgi:hypothetical protein